MSDEVHDSQLNIFLTYHDYIMEITRRSQNGTKYASR